MFIELSDFLLLAVIALIAWVWWQGQRSKEIALQAAKRQCESLDLQFLDQSVAMRRLWFKRDESGRLHFWRSYSFDFSSTGEERYSGQVVLLGRQVTSMKLEPHRFEAE